MPEGANAGRGPALLALLSLLALGLGAYAAARRGGAGLRPAPTNHEPRATEQDAPLSAASWLQRAEDQRQAGNYLGAEQSLVQVLRLRPNDAGAAEWLEQVRWLIAQAPADAPLDGSGAQPPINREELVRLALLANARALLNEAEGALRAGRDAAAAAAKKLIGADLEKLGWPPELTERYRRLPDP